MNLVDAIKNQLFSDGHLSQLSELIGAGEGVTKSAIGAAVPSLLSALSNLASSSRGAEKLASALGHFDAGSMGHTTHMLAGHADSVLEQGSGLLNSLLGGNTLSGIISAVSRFSGIGSGAVQKLLGFLMPMILGGIAGRFAGRAASAQALTGLLADQKAAITHALPSGFSLNDVPGLAAVGSAARGAKDATTSAGSALLKWALPAAALAAIVFVVWWFFRPGSSPVLNVPTADFTKVSTELTGDFKSLTNSLTSIKDAASASAALPQLKELDSKLDGMKALVEKLPDADKGKVTDLIRASFGKVEDQFAKLLWIPGVGDTIKPTVDEIMGKLAALGGLPVPKVSNVSADLAGAFSSLTASLTGIKDTVTAEAALPKLKDISDKLDGAKNTLEGLPEAGRSTILAQAKTALGKLQELADKVLAMAGVGDKIRPTLEALMGKLRALVA
jgi:hypothetical protein